MSVEGLVPEKAATPETNGATPPAEPKARDPNEARLAHLAKQQKAIRAEQARVKSDREQFKAEREQFAKERQEAEETRAWRTRLSKGDFEALTEAGVTKDQLTNYLVNQPNPTDREILALKSELDLIKEKQGSTEKAMAEKTQRDYDQAVKQITNETTLLVSGNPEKYELIQANGAADAVVELIKQTFDSENHILSVEDACNEVEEYLFEESIKLMSLKKIKSKFNPEPVGTQFKDVPKSKKETFSTSVRDMPRATPAKTLTHQQLPLTPDKPLTNRDRRERAIAAFQGRLNK